MKKAIIITIGILLIAAFLFFSRGFITGRVIQTDIHSYTYAICNDTNYCEDYLVECEGETPTRISPTGFSIQHEQDWEDSRENHNFCE